MKRILWIFYLLLTLGQVAMNKERPEVFFSELNYFLREESSQKQVKQTATPCSELKGSRSNSY